MKLTLSTSQSGRIDKSSAQILHQALHSAISDTNTLILDFHNVSYISSSGLRGLLIAKKRLGKNCLLLPCAGHEPYTDSQCFRHTGFLAAPQ